MSKGKRNSKCGVIRFEDKNRAKAFLRKVRELDREVDAAMRQVDYCEATATRITPHYSHTTKKPSGNVSENKIINLMGAREKCNKAIDCFLDYRDECLRLIDLIPFAAHKQVLMLRYLNYFKWEKIEKEMKYSEAQMFRIHGQALAEFEKVLQTSANHDSK